MGEERKLVVEGFTFELTGFFSADGATTVTVGVNGSGESLSDLKGWAMEVCPANPSYFSDEVSIISCEKRRRHGAWLPATAQKTSFELTGDIGFTGVVISDWVGRYSEDPDVEYRIVFDRELKLEPFSVAMITGDNACRAAGRIGIERTAPPSQNMLWVTPLEKSFSLFVVVPDGYKPEGACKVAVSVTKRAAFVIHHKGEFVVDDISAPEEKALKTMRAELLGSIRVLANVPLKSAQACGDSVRVSSVDCFEVCETIGYADDDMAFELSDVTVCPKKQSFDLTLLNVRSGRSVYRLDGKFVIDCKRCAQPHEKAIE